MSSKVRIFDFELWPASSIIFLFRSCAARVKIFVFNISDSLQLSDKEGEEMTQHIVGTRTEDLMQIYSGRIVIKGTLSLQNVQFSDAAANRSALVVDGTPFDLFSVHDQYWMKSIDQVSATDGAGWYLSPN